MISMIFLKLKRPSFGNMYVHCRIIKLTCIVVTVDSRCVCVCGWVGSSGGGGLLSVHYES